ncbi:MAG: septation protein A [Sutterella sp.]|nr:septation protein A [Sutterella sp.]
MKLFFDLFPIVLFFGVFKWAGSHGDAAAQWASQYLGAGITPESAPILLATATAILASIAQLIYLLVRRRKVEPMFWISLAVIVVFGGLTLYFREGAFIKWKPTILYWIFAGILLYGNVTGKNFIKQLLAKAELTMAERHWWMLQKLWIGFFVVLGALNLLVAYTFSLETWVNFKLFGLMGLTLVFTIGVAFFLAKVARQGQN